MKHVLIAGCGYLGTALGLRLAGAGRRVSGIRRDPSGLPPGIEGIAADLTDREALRKLPGPYDAVVYCAGASAPSEVGYRRAYLEGPRALLDAMGAWPRPPRRILFTSSTAVYAQTDGGWVDEDSPTVAAHFTGRILREAEELFLKNRDWHKRSEAETCLSQRFSAIVLRLGGIYGPGRTRLIESVRDGQATIAQGPPRYLNLNHRDDCAAAIQHLLELPEPAPVYLGVDDSPADRAEILRWVAGQLGAPSPPVVAEAAGQARGNKRCSNARLRATGFSFAYPSYREGYAPLIAAMKQTAP